MINVFMFSHTVNPLPVSLVPEPKIMTINIFLWDANQASDVQSLLHRGLHSRGPAMKNTHKHAHTLFH